MTLNRMVDQTGRDAAQYLLILWAAIRSPLRYSFRAANRNPYSCVKFAPLKYLI